MTTDKINRSPPRAGEEPPAPALVTGTVARGNTIEVPIPGSRHVVGFAGEGKNREEVFAQRCRSVGPGGQVELSADEAARLTASGALVDPDAVAPPLGGGPQY